MAHAPAAATRVIAAPTAQQASIDVSSALFASSPVAVVAAPEDASVSRAARIAEKLGVPLLVGDAANEPNDPNETAPVSGSSPSSPSRSMRTALDDELRRLGTSDVVSVGNPQRPDAVSVIDDGGVLPLTAPPQPVRGTTVLVDAPADMTATAAAATARAAGAAVVDVRGGDPRGDPHAIAALAHAPLQHVVAVGKGFGSAEQVASRVAVAHAGAQLPGGGQLVFPGRRFVALYGHPGAAVLGVLGEQDLDASIARVQQIASAYQPLSDVTVIPTFEIIATVAQGAPGRDGNYSAESSVDTLRPWVERARAAGLYVVLDLQPGRADILDQAKLYAPLLAYPNVGLAVDPEWQLGPTQLPLHQIGSIDSARLNALGAWLDAFTASRHLPQKLLVLHQFRLSMIGNEAALRTHYDNVAVLIHMDGQGTQPNKDATWRSVVAAAPKGLPFGWKNFYDEDHPMLTPEQTMTRSPKPMMISYQ